MRKASSTNLRNERWLLQECPFAVALSALGGRWGSAILWKVLRGHVRIPDLAAQLPLATEKMLTQELRRLAELGLLTKEVRSKRPLRVEYVATERGRSLEPLLAAMHAWGEDQRRSAVLPELELLDRTAEG